MRATVLIPDIVGSGYIWEEFVVISYYLLCLAGSNEKNEEDEMERMNEEQSDLFRSIEFSCASSSGCFSKSMPCGSIYLI